MVIPRLYLNIVILLFLLTSIPITLVSNNRIDSLINVLENQQEIEKANTLNEIALHFLRKNNIEESKQYSNEALKFAIDNENKLEEAKALNFLGIIERKNGNNEEALKKFKSTIQIAEDIDEKKLLSRSLNNVGLTYFGMGKYDEAINYYSQALQIKEEIGDIRGKGISLNNIGNVYSANDQYEESIDYYHQALKVFEEIGFKNGVASCLNNIGLIYNKWYQQHSNNLQLSENAVSYFNKAINIFEELNNPFEIANAKANIGNTYDLQRDTLKAIKYYKQSLQIRNEINDLSGVVKSSINLGSIYIKKADYTKAVEYFQKALHINEDLNNPYDATLILNRLGAIAYNYKDYKKAINYFNLSNEIALEINYRDLIRTNYELLAYTFDSMNNIDQSYKYYKLFIQIKDTLFSEESHQQLAELQTKYETEKKEQQIELQNAEIAKNQAELKQQNAIIYSLFGGLFLVVVIVFVVYNSYKNKKRANKLLEEKNTHISNQRDQILKQKEEITSSIKYAERIQRAILPKDEVINEILPDNFILFKPRDIVSGDYYWSTKKNNKIVIAAADCTGHGVPGAFMSMLGVSFLNEIVNKKNVLSAGEILSDLRNHVKDTLGQTGKAGEAKDGMDIALCVIDYENLKMQYAGAYNPLYYFRGGEFFEVKADKMPIGIHVKEKDTFTNHLLDIEKGDTYYIFSDGFVDQFGGEKGGKYKAKPFKTLLSELSKLPMKEQKERLEVEFDQWKGRHEQVDDVTIIGLKI